MVCIALIATDRLYAQDVDMHYAGDIHAVYGFTTKVNGFDTYQGRVALGTVHGVGCKYGSTGIGVDAVMYTHYYKDDGIRLTVVPYWSIQPALPLGSSFSVMLDGALGYYFPVLNWREGGDKGGMFLRYGAGIKLGRLKLVGGLEKYSGGYIDDSQAKGTVTPYVRMSIALGKR